MKNRNISPGRKAIYYIGLLFAVIGALMFFSVFISGALHFGDFSNFEEESRSSMLRAFGGMALIVIGAILSAIGRAGAAGSGIILDPERARTDLEPWARMTGGVVKDALDEADISFSTKATSAASSFDEDLRKLHKLREDEIISDSEYEEQKKRILDRIQA
jgi:hypothetical protein